MCEVKRTKLHQREQTIQSGHWILTQISGSGKWDRPQN